MKDLKVVIFHRVKVIMLEVSIDQLLETLIVLVGFFFDV